MPTITLTRNLESETLHLPELRPFVGHRVEIVVRDSEPSPELADARTALLKTFSLNSGVASDRCERFARR